MVGCWHGMGTSNVSAKSVHTQGYPNCGTPTGGKRTLQLLRTPGHSIDGISVMVEDCRVLVAGDCARIGQMAWTQ